MWTLVIASPQVVERPDGGVATLRALGCRVRAADLGDPRESDATIASSPPAAVLVEALDQVDPIEAGRAAPARLRSAGALRETPVLPAATVRALQRLAPEDAFDDVVRVPHVGVGDEVRA
jgi:hypothetical protein